MEDLSAEAMRLKWVEDYSRRPRLVVVPLKVEGTERAPHLPSLGESVKESQY